MDASVSTPQAVATVIAVEGQAFARDPAGQMRPLKPGDVLLEGDTIVTLPGGQVQLAFLDGQMLTLLPNESFRFTAETSPTSRPEVAEAALPAGEAERIIQALERGEDIDDLLDPTAAGLDGGGGGAGNGFVRLLRIVEGTGDAAPLEFGFTEPAAKGPFDEKEDLAAGTANLTPPAGGAANTAPAANPDTVTVNEDSPVTIDVLANDTDADGDVLAVDSASAFNGTVVVNPDGTITYTPNLDFSGSDSVTYTVSDGRGGATTATVDVTVTPVNDPAIIAGQTTGAVTEDVAVSAGLISTSGALTVSDPDAGEAVFIPATLAGTYGSLTIDASGNWSYSATSSNPAIQALGTGDTLTDSITVATADGSTQLITVTMTGTDDATVISGTSTAAITESNAVQSASGTLSASDPDSSAAFVAQTNVAGSNGYGVFSINPAGAWTYTMDSPHNEFVAGTDYTDSITVATADGTPSTVTVTMTGTNDAAVISSGTGSVTEDGTLTTGGTLTISDVDAGQASFVAQPSTAGAYGTFAINSAGAWTYSLNNSNATVQALNAGQVVTEVFSVATSDGGAASVTVNITGSNDVATLASATAALTETNAVLSTGGTLTLNDLDATAATVVAQTTAGTYGSFSIDAAGGWTYTTTDALDQLNAGQVVTEVFSVATSDGGAASVTVNITGSNDVAVLSATTTPIAVVEAANAVAQDLAPISGSFALTDMDVGDTLTASVVGNPTVLLNGASFTLPGSASALTAAGAFSLTSPGLSTGANQSVGYTYDPAAANLDFLRAGQNLAITYAVKVNDGMADSATQNVTFTLTGTNDAPVLSAIAAPASVAELANASAQDIAPINGILSVSDADVGDTLNALVSGTPTLVWSGGALTASQITTLTAALVSGKLTFGSAVLSDGAAKSIGYTWDPTAANLDFLARGQTLTVTYGVKVNDGTVDSTTQNVTFTITGTNDAPVANPDTLAATEDTAVTYTAAQLLGNDTDAEGNPLSIASVTSGVGGSVVLNGNGTVTFTPNANFSGTASFSYVASDGSATSNSANVTVNVAAVADSPQLITPGQLNALVAGVSSISTTAAVSNARLAGAIGLPSATLNSFDPPPGPGTNDPGTVNVNDGTLTNYNYTLSSGTSVVFNWAFTNGENLAGEINNGFNDIVVLVITNPNGTQTSTLITSSEQAGPATNTSGAYTFTAATAGSYQFSWLVLNGTDTAKDSSLTISNIAFQTGAITFGTPVDFPIATALVDTDGSETLSVTIAGVPAGAAFSAGTNLGGGIWSFTSAQLNGLIFLPADGYTGTINLTVTSTATETSNGSTASTTQTVAVTVAETTSTITGTDGNNNLTGTASNDHIQGLAGNDTLSGGAGNDLIYGGTGNDTLVGGTGNDTLIGGLGADTFKWQLNDGGSMASPATDTVKDFDNVNNSDKLDLRDLLVGESHAGTDPGNLVDYLHFEVSGSNTIIQISSSGGFSGGYSAGATDQRIVLNNTDLTGGGTLSADQQIIQDLLSKGKLITD